MASLRPPTRTSPPRKPLHERSDSHNNERPSPTLRPVGEPEAHVYTASPFPSLPSHILHPKGGGRQGFVFEDDRMDVSDNGPTITPEHEIQAIAPLRIRKAKDIATERDGNNGSQSRRSYYERSFFTAPAPTLPNRLSQPTPKELDARNQSASMKNPRTSHEPITEEAMTSSIPRREEALGSHGLPQEFKLVPRQTPQPPSIPAKSSDTSLSSTESTGTVIRTKPQPRRGSYSAFPPYPRPGSSKSNSSVSPSPKPASSKSDEDILPGSPVSPISPILSSFSSPGTHRTPATSQTSRRYPSSQDGISIQYPAIRSPSASGSWAESSSSAFTRPPRTLNRNSDRWNPHLSAVPSEDTEERYSGTMWLAGGSRNTSVPQASSPKSNTGILPPPPALLTVTRDVSDSTIRVVDEREDEVTALPAMPVPESRGSAFHPGYPGHSFRDTRRPALLQPRPSSRGSFLRDSIPAWARVYYARPGTSSRPPTRASNSTDLSGGLSRPRSRPHRIPVPERGYHSMAVNPAEGGPVVVGMHGQPQRRPSQLWSPHLWHDGRCIGKRRSMFIAPSIDEQVKGTGMRRRNAQVWLFTLGFIFPFAWFIASVLPLPPKPPKVGSKEPEHRLSRLELAQDLEKTLGLAGQARYENARWWRNLNRGMSVLGVIILVAIIALAVVAVHMRNR